MTKTTAVPAHWVAALDDIARTGWTKHGRIRRAFEARGWIEGRTVTEDGIHGQAGDYRYWLTALGSDVREEAQQ